MAIQNSNNSQPNGVNPLAYLGVSAANPPDLTVNSVNPLPSNLAFSIGTLWVNASSGSAFMLTRFFDGAADWVQLYPSTAVGTTTFHTPMGTATESGGAINIDGVGLVETFASGSTVNIALTEGLNGQIPIAATGFATEYATITAGSGISVTNGPNSITISSSSSIVGYTPVNHSMSPYTVLVSDYYISCLTSTGTITILLPNSPSIGEIFVVKDRNGNAATNNVTVTTVGGVVLIDGLTSFVMNTSYESSQFIFNGSAYEVF